MALTQTQIQAQIDWLEALIPQLRSAILALSSGTAKSYSINDGQSSQSVTKKEVPGLRIQLTSALDELSQWQGQSSGGGVYLR